MNRIVFRLGIIGCVWTCVFMWGCEKKLDTLPIQPAQGVLHILDSGGVEGDTGWWPSVVFDEGDRPHLSYCDAFKGDLKYATKVKGKWVVEDAVTDGAVGKYTSIAVNKEGTIGIAYYDQDRKYLRYAWRTIATNKKGKVKERQDWKTESVAWGLEVGMASELRFDKAGQAHIFYYIPSGRLIHAHRTKEKLWDKVAAAAATGSFSVSIDVRQKGDGFWLSYVHWTFSDTRLYMARSAGVGASSPFSSHLIAEHKGAGWHSQLLEMGSVPGLLYTRSHTGDLFFSYAPHKGERQDWHSQLLLNDVGNFEAAQASSGEMVVVYEDIHGGEPGRGIVRYLKFKPASEGVRVQRFEFDTMGPSGQYLDVALNSKSQAVIAYYALDIRGLKVWDETGSQ
jgi:hypothetical protein